MGEAVAFRDLETFKRGKSGELIVAEVLQKQKWLILPSYDYSAGETKPPKLVGRGTSLVVPDLGAFRDGAARWVEVKLKAEATWTRKTQQFEHGIALRHFKEYQAVQRVTGMPVYLAVYEENTGDVLCATIDALDKVKRIYQGSKMDGGNVFFARSAFGVIANVNGKPILKEATLQ